MGIYDESLIADAIAYAEKGRLLDVKKTLSDIPVEELPKDIVELLINVNCELDYLDDNIEIHNKIVQDGLEVTHKEYCLALIRKQNKDYYDAKELFLIALKNNDFDDHIYYDYADMLCDMNEYEDAILYYKKAIESGLESGPIYFGLGYALSKAEHHDEALELYNTVKEKFPNTIGVMFNIGNIYSKLGDHENAKKAFEEELKLEKPYFYTWYNLALLYKEEKDYEKAKIYYLEGIKNLKERLPKDKSLKKPYAYHWYNLVCVYALANDYKNAADCLIMLNGIDPECAKYISTDKEVEWFLKSKEFRAIEDKMRGH